MTIRWCAYCQEFLGEKAPFENFDISHGICPACAKRGLDISEGDFYRAKRLADIQKTLLETGGRDASPAEAAALVENAVSMGIKPIDILMGFVTQLLRHIGEKWARGEVTVAEEHCYTAFCERILSLVEAKIQWFDPVGDGKMSDLDVLIVTAPGNIHTLGNRIAALWLNSRGIRAQSIYPSLPEPEILVLLSARRPKYLGISISIADQVPAVKGLVELIRSGPAAVQPRLILGGFAVKQNQVPEIPGATLVADLMAFFLKDAILKASAVA